MHAGPIQSQINYHNAWREHIHGVMFGDTHHPKFVSSSISILTSADIAQMGKRLAQHPTHNSTVNSSRSSKQSCDESTVFGMGVMPSQDGPNAWRRKIMEAAAARKRIRNGISNDAPAGWDHSNVNLSNPPLDLPNKPLKTSVATQTPRKRSSSMTNNAQTSATTPLSTRETSPTSPSHDLNTDQTKNLVPAPLVQCQSQPPSIPVTIGVGSAHSILDTVGGTSSFGEVGLGAGESVPTICDAFEPKSQSLSVRVGAVEGLPCRSSDEDALDIATPLNSSISRPSETHASIANTPSANEQARKNLSLEAIAFGRSTDSDASRNHSNVQHRQGVSPSVPSHFGKEAGEGSFSYSTDACQTGQEVESEPSGGAAFDPKQMHAHTLRQTRAIAAPQVVDTSATHLPPAFGNCEVATKRLDSRPSAVTGAEHAPPPPSLRGTRRIDRPAIAGGGSYAASMFQSGHTERAAPLLSSTTAHRRQAGEGQRQPLLPPPATFASCPVSTSMRTSTTATSPLSYRQMVAQIDEEMSVECGRGEKLRRRRNRMDGVADARWKASKGSSSNRQTETNRNNPPSANSTQTLTLSPSRTVTLDNINQILPYFYSVPLPDSVIPSPKQPKKEQKSKWVAESDDEMHFARGIQALGVGEVESEKNEWRGSSGTENRSLSPVERIRQQNDKWWRDYFTMYGGKCAESARGLAARSAQILSTRSILGAGDSPNPTAQAPVSVSARAELREPSDDRPVSHVFNVHNLTSTSSLASERARVLSVLSSVGNLQPQEEQPRVHSLSPSRSRWGSSEPVFGHAWDDVEVSDVSEGEEVRHSRRSSQR